MKLQDLARQLGCPLDGAGDVDVTRVATIADAGPGDVTFLGNSKYAGAVATTRAACAARGAGRPETRSSTRAVERTSERRVGRMAHLRVYYPEYVTGLRVAGRAPPTR